MVKKSNTRKIKKLSRKAERILLLSVFLPLFGGMIWVIFYYGDVDSYIFWIAGIIEVIIAYVTMTLKRREFFVPIFMAAILIPFFISNNMFFHLPIRMVWMIYILAGSIIGVYSLYRPRKPRSVTIRLEEWFITPEYLPQGYKEDERNVWKKKGASFVEQIFDNEIDEHIIWLLESTRPFTDYKPMKNTEPIQKEIKGVMVNIDREILKPDSKHGTNNDIPFIEANWGHDNINFNLRSDGIHLGEAEKIITSMIK
jgi:hypothetical protein